MAERTKKPRAQTQTADVGEIAAPFSGVLAKTVDKLTSQIFLFVIAYVMVVAALAYWGVEVPVELRTAVCLLPGLAIAAYVYLERSKIRQTVQAHGIDVRARIATSGAQVTGVRGGAAPEGDVNVRVGVATGKAQVVGLDYGRGGDTGGEANLLEVYRKLNAAERGRLFSKALTALEKQQSGPEEP
jgi:hypothetical protein